MLKYIPNALTIFRFFLIPVIIIACVQGEYILAIILLTISGITDILDGMIARKFELVSNFGKLMDPLADKATQISVLTTLVINGTISIWIVVIVVLKEFCMISGASFLYGKELVVSSKWYGKLATVLFYIAMVISLVSEEIAIKTNQVFEIIKIISNIAYFLAITAAIVSLIMYIRAFYIQGYLKKTKNE